MKRLFTIILCLSAYTLCYAGIREEIDIKDMLPPPTTPRSVVLKPTVQLDVQAATLYVKFLALTESYTLSVEDAQGNIIYQAPLSTTGVEDLHLLGDMESGSYTLRIESGKRTFVGDFDI